MSKKRELTPQELKESSDLKKIFQERKESKKGVTQAKAAEALGITQGAVNHYLNGINALNAKTASDFAKFLNANVRDFSPRLADEIENLSAANTSPGPDVYNEVPLISWVQAGHWSEAVDLLQPGEGERIATTYRPRRHTYALRVNGDSMEPEFTEGDIIIVEPDETPRHGSYVVIRQNGSEATFKKLIIDGGKTYLAPLNNRYPLLELKDDATFCGVIKEKIKRY